VTDQLGALGLDTAVPEGVRAMAEKSVAQTREVYDRSKTALDASVATFERAFDAAGQGAAAFNASRFKEPFDADTLDDQDRHVSSAL
jgi:hypothetical protein